MMDQLAKDCVCGEGQRGSEILPCKPELILPHSTLVWRLAEDIMSEKKNLYPAQ